MACEVDEASVRQADSKGDVVESGEKAGKRRVDADQTSGQAG